MSKKQEKLHKQSLLRIAAYEALPTEKKKGETRPKLISCKRVEKNEADSYSIGECLNFLIKKGVIVTNNILRVTNKVSEIGLKTKAKIDYLKTQGYNVVMAFN